MGIAIYKADSRGNADLGWLQTRYSFSFSGYYDPKRMGFGALRVLNDDTIAAGKGFGKHPHDHMEIVTIVLSGALEHQDSMGNKGIIRAGEVQHMSAGKGIVHAEYNASDKESVQLLQIWIEPAKRDIEPRYAQASLAELDLKNKLVPIVSGKEGEAPLAMNQDARILFGHLEKGQKVAQQLSQGKGAFVFVLSGNIAFNGYEIATRDAAELTDISKYTLHAKETAQLLIIEVPGFA
jgi:redox-sensitive bicupin YhaK (pirin superfamily)